MQRFVKKTAVLGAFGSGVVAISLGLSQNLNWCNNVTVQGKRDPGTNIVRTRLYVNTYLPGTVYLPSNVQDRWILGPNTRIAKEEPQPEWHYVWPLIGIELDTLECDGPCDAILNTDIPYPDAGFIQKKLQIK